MSEISLEWFFQIPGLFITVGVLLILIALLVLIIGGSRARRKDENFDVEENIQMSIDDELVVDSVANINGLNSIDNNSLNNFNNMNNNLNGIDGGNNINNNFNNLNYSALNNNDLNNLSNINANPNLNNINTDVNTNSNIDNNLAIENQVQFGLNSGINNSNVMPINNVGQNIVTPVNVNENNQNLQNVLGNNGGVNSVSTTSESNIIPNIVQPVLSNNQLGVNSDIDNANSSTIVPVQTNIPLVSDINVATPIEQSINTLGNNDLINAQNILVDPALGNVNSQPVVANENIVQPLPVMEQVSTIPQVEDLGNNIVVPPIVNDQQSIKNNINNDIEEIL